MTTKNSDDILDMLFNEYDGVLAKETLFNDDIDNNGEKNCMSVAELSPSFIVPDLNLALDLDDIPPLQLSPDDMTGFGPVEHFFSNQSPNSFHDLSLSPHSSSSDDRSSSTCAGSTGLDPNFSSVCFEKDAAIANSHLCDHPYSTVVNNKIALEQSNVSSTSSRPASTDFDTIDMSAIEDDRTGTESGDDILTKALLSSFSDVFDQDVSQFMQKDQDCDNGSTGHNPLASTSDYVLLEIPSHLFIADNDKSSCSNNSERRSSEGEQSNVRSEDDEVDDLLSDVIQLSPKDELQELEDAVHLTAEEKELFIKEGMSLPTGTPLTKTEERNLKTIRRKIRNKVSARNSRRKRQDYIDGLEERVHKCTKENSELKRRLTSAAKEKVSLMEHVRKLQTLLTQFSGHSPTGTGTVLMVCIMSFALFIAPGLWTNKLNSLSSTSSFALQSRQDQESFLAPQEPVFSRRLQSQAEDRYPFISRHTSSSSSTFSEEQHQETNHKIDHGHVTSHVTQLENEKVSDGVKLPSVMKDSGAKEDQQGSHTFPETMESDLVEQENVSSLIVPNPDLVATPLKMIVSLPDVATNSAEVIDV